MSIANENENASELETSAADSTSFLSGITVASKAWYLTVFNVTYRIGSTFYEKESPHFAAGGAQEIQIPFDAQEVGLKVDLFTGIGTRKRIFTQQFGEAVRKCYTVWGSVSHPEWGEYPCPV